MIKGKSWWKSRTLWFNLLTIILGTVQIVVDVYPVPAEILTIIMGVGNMLLRMVTVEPVTLK